MGLAAGVVWLATNCWGLPFFYPRDTGPVLSFAALYTKMDTTFTLLNMKGENKYHRFIVNSIRYVKWY